MIWLSIVLLVVCSGITSGSETALFALDRLTLNHFRNSDSLWRRRVVRVMQHPHRVLMTVLLTNTTINVAIFSLSCVALANIKAEYPAISAVGGVVVLFTVITFGEMIPKAVALSAARLISPVAATVVSAIEWVVFPVQWVLSTLLVAPLTKLLSPPAPSGDLVETDELRMLVERSTKQGVITSKENEMLRAVVAMRQAGVREVMTPRVDIKYLRLEDTGEVVRETLRTSHRRKLPVCGRDLDDIKGVLYARDVYLSPDKPIRALLRPANFVPEQVRLVQLLRHFRREGIQFAIVVDEYGGTTGLVSVEDVLEQIVGDLGEYDRAPTPPATDCIDENNYRLSGDLSVRVWADLFGVKEFNRRIDTLGGLVVAKLGKMPQIGDRIQIRNLELVVVEVEGRRIERVLLRRLPRKAMEGLQP